MRMTIEERINKYLISEGMNNFKAEQKGQGLKIYRKKGSELVGTINYPVMPGDSVSFVDTRKLSQKEMKEVMELVQSFVSQRKR